MKSAITLLLLSLSIAGCAREVEQLSLRDARLPMEARRWLADAEDEVSITRARVVDAEERLNRVKAYREETVSRLKGAWASSKAGPDGTRAWQAFKEYADSRVGLETLSLDIAILERDLALKRLTQARAETAMRYDLDVYELAPIIEDVTEQRRAVAAMTKRVEEQRVQVERKADAAWKAFYAYVHRGGIGDSLWYAE